MLKPARAASLVAAVVIAFALAACSDGGAALDRLSLGERGKVVSVQSGEVLTLDNGLVVRLASLEAPFPDEPGGPAAQADLAKRVAGRQVELRYGGLRRDSQGRALAQVRLADSRAWVQGALLRDGMARVRTWADNRGMAQPMLNDEARARIAKAGLWGQGVFRVLIPPEVGRNDQGFQIVEGRARVITPTRQGVYLDFSDDKRGFAVRVDDKALSDFAAAGTPVQSLVGRLIRVRGPVGWNAVMTVDHPEQVEFLKSR
jgi:endonuclease YncB( thermonuclease family)